MPLNFKPKAIDTAAILKMAGLGPAGYEGVTITLGSNELIVSLGGHDLHVDVSAGSMLSISKGTLGPATKMMVATAIKKAVADLAMAAGQETFGSSALSMLKAKNTEPDFTFNEAVKTLADDAIEAAIEKLNDELMSEAETGTQSGKLTVPVPNLQSIPKAKGIFPKDKMHLTDPIPLLEATQLYQPVNGTSSRYYAVALNPNIKVAARYSGGTLSARVEGEAFLQFKQRIEAAGFDVKSNTYASVHVHCGEDKKTAAKALGALIGGLDMQFDTPAPRFDVISAG